MSLERLSALASQPPQRIGLSATAAPLSEAARFLTGMGRPCAIAEVREETPLDLRIMPLADGPAFIADLVRRLVAGSRRPGHPDLHQHVPAGGAAGVGAARAAAGAGTIKSPSTIRRSRRIGAARSRGGSARGCAWWSAAPASNSASTSVRSTGGAGASAGRRGAAACSVSAGRATGRARVRRGLVLTSSAAELLEAVVTGASGRAAQCEALHVPAHPLDVLCQQIAGMASAGDVVGGRGVWRCAAPTPIAISHEKISTTASTTYAAWTSTADPWLPPRLRGDAGAFSIRDERTARLLRRNLGTILAAERVAVLAPFGPTGGDASPAWRQIGDVDQAFAERLQPGDRFLLDGRCLEFRRREAGDGVRGGGWAGRRRRSGRRRLAAVGGTGAPAVLLRARAAERPATGRRCWAKFVAARLRPGGARRPSCCSTTSSARSASARFLIPYLC